jgi:hypothetical protein
MSAAANEKQKRIYTIIFCVLALLCAAVLFTFACKSFSRIQKCSAEVSAEFVGYRKIKHSSGTGSRYVNYYPTFIYAYGDKVYEAEGDNTYSRDKTEGEVQSLFVDPDDPQQFIDPSDKTVKVFPVLMIVGGVFMSATAVWLLTDTIKKARTQSKR